MLNNNWKKEIFTIPNLLSLFRLVLLPVYVCIYLNAEEPFQFYTAGIVMAVSCVTDLIDGKIARHFHMVTTLGKILDPLADKITQFTLTMCLSLKYPVLIPVLLLLLVKELVQTTLGVHHLLHGKMLPGALAAGKICTAVLFVSLITLVMFPKIHPETVVLIALTDSFFLIVSFFSYLSAYFGRHPLVEDLKRNG